MGARSGRADSASALPHLGGSERPRSTAPHLAGPPLPPTLSAGAGRRGGTGGAGGGAWGRGRPTLGGGRGGTRGLWASPLSAGKVLLGEGGLKRQKKVGSEGQLGRRKAKWWGDPAGQV